MSQKEKIKKLYEKKINLLLNGRRDFELTKNDLQILKKLEKAQMFDPRYEDIHFEKEVDALKGKIIADKLDSMSEGEFMISEYPYRWIDELAGASILKVLNKKILQKGK